MDIVLTRTIPKRVRWHLKRKKRYIKPEHERSILLKDCKITGLGATPLEFDVSYRLLTPMKGSSSMHISTPSMEFPISEEFNRQCLLNPDSQSTLVDTLTGIPKQGKGTRIANGTLGTEFLMNFENIPLFTSKFPKDDSNGS